MWNNLPLPELSGDEQLRIIDAGREVQAAREVHRDATLAQLYQRDAMPADLRDAHDRLDRLVDESFGAESSGTTLADRQRLLFERYDDLTR